MKNKELTPSKAKNLAGGFMIGSAWDLVGFDSEEAALAELKYQLAIEFKKRREDARMTQAELAKRLKTSQSRLAIIEKAGKSVSLDVLVKGLRVLGITNKELGMKIVECPG